MHLFIHLPTFHSFIHLLIHVYVHTFIHAFAYLLAYLFIHEYVLSTCLEGLWSLGEHRTMNKPEGPM